MWQVDGDENADWQLGDTVTMTFADTGEQTFTVRSIFDEQGPTSGYAISLAAFDANVADARRQLRAVIDAAQGYSSEQVRHAHGDDARPTTRTPT